MHEPQSPIVVLVGSKAKEGEGVVYYNMREFCVVGLGMARPSLLEVILNSIDLVISLWKKQQSRSLPIKLENC